MSFPRVSCSPASAESVGTSLSSMMDVRDPNLAALLDAAVVDPNADAENAMPDVTDNLDAFCNSKIALLVPLPLKRPEVIMKEFEVLTKVFASVPVVRNLHGSDLRLCLEAISEIMEVNPFLIAAAISRNEKAFVKYFPALSVFRRHALQAAEMITVFLKENILLFDNASAGTSLRPSIIEILDNLLAINHADEYGMLFRETEELHALRVIIDNCVVPTTVSISHIRGAFDVFVQKYPDAQSVADSYLYQLFHNYDGEYQTEVFAWMKNVRATKGPMSYRLLLNEYCQSMASKINAHKKRTIVPTKFEAISSSSATPPLVLALQLADSSSSQETQSRAKTCQAAYDILARLIRRNDKRHGICSHCLFTGHTWIACPNRSDIFKGVGNLIQPDFAKVAGVAVQPRWSSLFESYKPDTAAGPQE